MILSYITRLASCWTQSTNHSSPRTPYVALLHSVYGVIQILSLMGQLASASFCDSYPPSPLRTVLTIKSATSARDKRTLTQSIMSFCSSV